MEYYSSPSSETESKRPAKRNLLCFFTMYIERCEISGNKETKRKWEEADDHDKLEANKKLII